MKKIITKYKNLPEAVKASLWFTICSILQKGISFITVPIFTRLLTTEQYGVVSIFYSWESIFIIFCTLLQVLARFFVRCGRDIITFRAYLHPPPTGPLQLSKSLQSCPISSSFSALISKSRFPSLIFLAAFCNFCSGTDTAR